MKTVYEILGMKQKNSIFKSVMVTNQKTYEGFKIVEVEPYDDTFLNATANATKYDNTVDRITEKLTKMFEEPLWVIVYTDNFGKSELLINY